MYKEDYPDSLSELTWLLQNMNLAGPGNVSFRRYQRVIELVHQYGRYA